MKFKYTGYSLLLLLFIVACKDKSTNAIDTGNETIEIQKRDVLNDRLEADELIHEDDTEQWSYDGETGPSHWAEFLEDSDCGGMAQSPINIISRDAKSDITLGALQFKYSKKTKIRDVTNNGQSIQFNFEPGNTVIYNGETYNLLQFHFHEASEHTINGVRFPLETDFVHQNDKGKTLIIGVLSEEGKENTPWTTLESHLPIEKNVTIPLDIPFDVTSLLPDNRAYYSYKGSLTTPPCSEDVQWIVFKNQTSISKDQLNHLQSSMPLNNYRNVQPLNGRVVHISH